MNKKNAFVLWFSELGIEDVPLVGGKNASLGEMYRNLTKKHVNVPNGFAITAHAYRYLIDKAGIKDHIRAILKDLNTHDMKNLSERGHKVRETVLKAKFPPELELEILTAYKQLCKQVGYKVEVAVRSSATAEDLPDASFAGQQETYLNIKGDHMLLDACRKCFASLFTNRAISYRVDRGFDHFDIALSIGVQLMVRSDMASSGVMFSIDTETGFKDAVLITGAWGLGENVVQGAVNPDQFYVFKPTLNKGYRPIINKKLGSKRMRMVYSNESAKASTKNVATPLPMQEKFVITDDEILKLAEWAVIIEEHYSKKAGKFKPMDMEWAKDGKTGRLYIVQARPETVQSQKDVNILEEYKLSEIGPELIKGMSIGSKIGSGKANVIKDVHRIGDFKKGEVLVTDMTDPDWEPIMKIAAAIVTNRGGRTCFGGSTKILTNKGFLTMEQIFEDYRGLQVPSLNRTTLKMEWKPVLAAMRKRSRLMRVVTSRTGRARHNCLDITPDHKMISLCGGKIIDKEIQDVLKDQEMITLAQRIPALHESTEKDRNLAYFLGAVSTDGPVPISGTPGEVQFIQKPSEEKEEFIKTMKNHAKTVFNKEFKEVRENVSQGVIREQRAEGYANAHQLYSQQAACQIKHEQQQLAQTMLTADTELLCHFLAGVIDGDGSWNNNRIRMCISREYLAQAVIVACLRLGSVPRVTNNRHVYSIQIAEQVNAILQFTKRVKGTQQREWGSRFFGARNALEREGLVGQDKLRYDKNLLVSEKSLAKQGKRLEKLLASDLRQQRVAFDRDLGEDYAYNITVQDNHNYIVFSSQYSPILVNNCHAAIIARELGIPCVVGTETGTEAIKNSVGVTIDCSQGESGIVYKGELKFNVKKTNLKSLKRPKTKIMMNLGNPEQAFDASFLPNDGVGLAREEFIISSYVKVHPLALLNFAKLKDEKAKKQIGELTKNYKEKSEYFVDMLAQGVGMIAAAFYPKDVIVRMSDFKSNEYANLVGGKEFEPTEDNPMIGWRGASRYYAPRYEEAFRLECKAFRRVREEMGLTNLKLMIPFCRTVDEGKKVLAVMEKEGLKRGKNGLQVYVMCEIPSNVILADEFCKIFDGFSIGSNDLTQLTLGLDRDSELVSHIYSERNAAVKSLISQAIKVCKKNKRKIGICGDAPSSFPDFAEFLAKEGIDSMSLTPDAIIKTTIIVSKMEKK